MPSEDAFPTKEVWCSWAPIKVYLIDQLKRKEWVWQTAAAFANA